MSTNKQSVINKKDALMFIIKYRYKDIRAFVHRTAVSLFFILHWFNISSPIALTGCIFATNDYLLTYRFSGTLSMFSDCNKLEQYKRT